MKKNTLLSVLLTAACATAFAQVPVTSGLKLHLDAAIGFNDNGAAAATWQDQSPAGNHVTAGNASTAEPTYSSNALSSGTAGIIFDGTSDYMTRLAASTSGFTAANATLFVVRIGNTAVNTISSNYRTTLSIGQNNSFNNEFALMGNWAIHCTSSGNWFRRDHQCYSSLPNNLPAIMGGVINSGLTSGDIDFYVNGIKSTNAPGTTGTPAVLTTATRSIVVGGRYDGSATASPQSNTWFSGAILEVLAYDRILTQTEVDDVNNYLKCKYRVNYAACNTPLVCDPPPAPCDDLCYWRVTGNNINGTANILGTLSDDDIRIQTNSTDRGIITAGGSPTDGFLGWNTMSPTARLHVDCAGGDEESGYSDIRFENLEPGTGTLLAIDAQGYVYNTGLTPGGGGGGGTAWDVTGNTIAGGNNKLGTNSFDDVILRTNGNDIGILTSGVSGDPNDDGRLGWQTLTPTAHLHVNCAGGNPEDGGSGSDVRFERLERGHGTILVIDDQGYVYNSTVHLEDIHGKSEKMEAMQNEINALKALVNSMLNEKTSSIGQPAGHSDGSSLLQNTPNPFGKETVVQYFIHKIEQSAYIMVYDLNGRTISKYPIREKGQGTVTINANNLMAGVYMYSLVIDGQEIDSKRMVISK